MSEVIEVTRERQVENHKMLIELCKPWNPEHAAKEIERRFDGAKPAAALRVEAQPLRDALSALSDAIRKGLL